MGERSIENIYCGNPNCNGTLVINHEYHPCSCIFDAISVYQPSIPEVQFRNFEEVKHPENCTKNNHQYESNNLNLASYFQQYFKHAYNHYVA